jgi:excisionase family DNA binding protein
MTMPARKVAAANSDSTQEEVLGHGQQNSGQIAARRRSREPMQFHTIAEVAAFVGVSARSVRRWIKGGDLIAHRFGGAVRIAENDFRAFLAMHRDG